MANLLNKNNKHLFLEKPDKSPNSFIANMNSLSKSFRGLTSEDVLALKDIPATIVSTGEEWKLILEETALDLLAGATAFNTAIVTKITEDVPANSEITLPDIAKYVVGTNMLMLSYNGTVCYLGEQFEEIGEPHTDSNKIKILFDLRTDDVLEFRVIALNANVSNSAVIAEGSTEPRTLAERFGDIVNVKDFGAKGDGVTDDTVAFQRAIATGKAAFVPSGNYLLSEDITGAFFCFGDSVFFSGNRKANVLAIPSIAYECDDNAARFWGYFVLNDSLTAKNPCIYISRNGTDEISGPMHGLTETNAFATFNAAFKHVKKHIRNIGKHNTYTFVFDTGNWGDLDISGQDSFPGRICITSKYFDASRSCFADEVGSVNDVQNTEIDWPSVSTDEYPYGTDRWATFGTIKTLLHNGAVDIRGVRFHTLMSYYNHSVRVSDVRIIAKPNTDSQPYAFYCDIQCLMAIVNNVTWEEPVTYNPSPFYCQQQGFLSLENGDGRGADLYNWRKTTLVRLLGVSNITATVKFDVHVAGVFLGGKNVYPQMTYAQKYRLDSTSFAYSRDLDNVSHWEDNNFRLGGPCVEQDTLNARGYRIFPNGYGEEWAVIQVNNIASGSSSCAASFTPRLKFNSVPHVLVQTPLPYITPRIHTQTQTKYCIPLDFENSYSSKRDSYFYIAVKGLLRESSLTDVNNHPLQADIMDVESLRPYPLAVERTGENTFRIVWTISVAVANPDGSDFTVMLDGTATTITQAEVSGNRYNFVTITTSDTISSNARIYVSGIAGAINSTYGSIPNNTFNIANK